MKEINNIGSVIYTWTNEGILAQWAYLKNNEVKTGTGTGVRLTQPISEYKFEGDYEIIYTNENGDKSPKLTVLIKHHVDHYIITWKHNKKTTDMGIGIENDNILSIGYHEVNI